MQAESGAPSPSNPDLARIVGRLEAQRREALALLEPLDAQRFNWRPGPERWSVGQCMHHLNQTNGRLLPVLEQAVARGREANRTADGPFRYGPFARWFRDSLKPEFKKPLKSPRIYRPSASQLDMAQVADEFDTSLETLSEIVGRADGLDLAGIKAASPVSRFLRIPLGIWFESVVVHDDRHLQQARRVTAEPGFGRQG
jgi:hypothetical protein